MSDAPQARFDAPEHDRNRLVRFAYALRIDDDTAIGTFTPEATGGVGIIAAHAPVRGVAIDHRIHIAAGHAEEQTRRTQGLEVARAAPVRLRDDPYFKTLRLQHPANDGHSEAGMIDIGIP